MNPPVLVPPIPGEPLILNLTMHEKSMGCVLGQYDETGQKERAIYYLSKKLQIMSPSIHHWRKCVVHWLGQLKGSNNICCTIPQGSLQNWILLSTSSKNHFCLGELQDGKCYYQNLISFMYPRRLLRETQ